jgi:hypothetical protein
MQGRRGQGRLHRQIDHAFAAYGVNDTNNGPDRAPTRKSLTRTEFDSRYFLTGSLPGYRLVRLL